MFGKIALPSFKLGTPPSKGGVLSNYTIGHQKKSTWRESNPHRAGLQAAAFTIRPQVQIKIAMEGIEPPRGGFLVPDPHPLLYPTELHGQKAPLWSRTKNRRLTGPLLYQLSQRGGNCRGGIRTPIFRNQIPADLPFRLPNKKKQPGTDSNRRPRGIRSPNSTRLSYPAKKNIMGRDGFEPPRGLTNEFTVRSFQPLRHRPIKKNIPGGNRTPILDVKNRTPNHWRTGTKGNRRDLNPHSLCHRGSHPTAGFNHPTSNLSTIVKPFSNDSLSAASTNSATVPKIKEDRGLEPHPERVPGFQGRFVTGDGVFLKNFTRTRRSRTPQPQKVPAFPHPNPKE